MRRPVSIHRLREVWSTFLVRFNYTRVLVHDTCEFVASICDVKNVCLA